MVHSMTRIDVESDLVSTDGGVFIDKHPMNAGNEEFSTLEHEHPSRIVITAFRCTIRFEYCPRPSKYCITINNS